MPFMRLYIIDTLSNLYSGLQNTSSIRINLEHPELPKGMDKFLLDCFETAPSKRPTLKMFNQYMKSYGRVGMVESLMKRLAMYSVDLEWKVGDRTQELKEERRKVDALLAEMIPL